MSTLRILFYLFVFSGYNTYVTAQTSTKAFSTLSLESSFSLTPLDDFQDPLTSEPHTFYQQIWYTALFSRINKHYWMGLHYSALRDFHNRKTIGRYYLAGLLNRFEIPLIKSLSIQTDIGFSQGNICNCNLRLPKNNWPFKREDSWYLSLGFNFRIQVVKSFHLLIGFNTYDVLAKEYDDYTYVQILTGLQVRLGDQ